MFCLLILQKDYTANDKEYEEGQEVLRVRAYGLSFFTLGINIRYQLVNHCQVAMLLWWWWCCFFLFYFFLVWSKISIWFHKYYKISRIFFLIE